jgi:hypothetical protein
VTWTRCAIFELRERVWRGVGKADTVELQPVGRKLLGRRQKTIIFPFEEEVAEDVFQVIFALWTGRK